MKPPTHYDKPVTPWCLQKHMESSGSVFADARRTDAIEYAFRMKGDPIEDMRKGAHCLLAAADELEAIAKGKKTDESIEIPAAPSGLDFETKY